MLRKCIGWTITVAALATLIVSAIGMVRPFYWRFDFVDTNATLVSVKLTGDRSAMGMEITKYSVQDPPQGSNEWQINDRVLRAAYERSDRGCQIARPGRGVRAFAGYVRMSAESPQWVLLTLAGFFLLMPLLARVRRRRKTVDDGPEQGSHRSESAKP